MAKAVIALGANLGERKQNIECALKMFAQKKCDVLAKSKFYETAPVGYLNQGDFINAAILIECEYSPLELLKICNEIELELGRVRSFKDAPRTFDADIIFYENVEMQTSTLTIPHSQWQVRDFVITPLLDLLESSEMAIDSFKKYTEFLSKKTRKFEEYKDERK